VVGLLRQYYSLMTFQSVFNGRVCMGDALVLYIAHDPSRDCVIGHSHAPSSTPNTLPPTAS
jgi:hypothetical protein